MADLSPRDVAVVLRSVGRRVAEAEAGADDGLDPRALADLDAAIADIALAVDGPTTGGRAHVTSALADRIEHVPASQWTEESLAKLRTGSASIGLALRHLASSTG